MAKDLSRYEFGMEMSLVLGPAVVSGIRKNEKDLTEAIEVAFPISDMIKLIGYDHNGRIEDRGLIGPRDKKFDYYQKLFRERRVAV